MLERMWSVGMKGISEIALLKQRERIAIILNQNATMENTLVYNQFQ